MTHVTDLLLEVIYQLSEMHFFYWTVIFRTSERIFLKHRGKCSFLIILHLKSTNWSIFYSLWAKKILDVLVWILDGRQTRYTIFVSSR